MLKKKHSAEDILQALSLKEKLALINGAAFLNMAPLRRFGLRGLRMADASMGLRDNFVAATAYPASIALSAGFNRKLSERYGDSIGREFSANGVDILLGPGVNHYRVPQCGRNFEYLGEDPYLASEMVVPYIKAVQESGVSATVKHFVANNSDYHRKASNSIVSRRALEEIYFPPFKAAIQKAGSKCLMTSYNLVNGEYAPENKWLLQDILLDDWGFEGVIMSDWYSNFHPIKSVESPLHLEMPGNVSLKANIVKRLLESGDVEIEDIDKKVKRILTFVLENENACVEKAERMRYRGEESLQVAYDVAAEGIVLLKNDASLPLKKDMQKLAIIGPSAKDTPIGGGGAALVKACEAYSIESAISEYLGTQNSNTEISTSWQDADTVVLCLGLNDKLEGEFFDRPFELPHEQIRLLRECHQKGKRIITVITGGGGFDLEEVDEKSSAVLHQWYPGENGCLALAHIIFGELNPSGKLPISIEKKFSDRSSSKNYLPPNTELYTGIDQGENLHDILDVNYEEGIFSGYRHFSSKNIEVLYPFGFGLSYTTFEYSGLQLVNDSESPELEITIKNNGKQAGKETVLFFVEPLEPKIERPRFELKGFEKVTLQAGESKTLRCQFEKEAFQYFDPKEEAWIKEAGKMKIWAAKSVEELLLSVEL